MTDEELKYYSHPQMQRKFRDAMGPYQVGDHVYKYGRIPVITETIIHIYASNHPFDTDRAASCREGSYIRLPLPIDPVNPERGLWGMVDWKGGFCLFVTDAGRLWVRDKDGSTIAYDTPTLALLKALVAQWRIEI